jgi:hypothetical protein
VAVVVNGRIPGVMRVLVMVGMVVDRVPVPVRVGMNDDLSGRVAAAAVGGPDLAGSPAFGTFFHFVKGFLDWHGGLLSGMAAPLRRPAR